jgi:hypothetical protein
MSIFDDKNLVNQLMYHGLSKRAQQYVGVGPQDFAALRGIIGNLEKQLTSPTSAVISGAKVGTESDQAASLNSTHMENLGTLVEFLTTNKITVDGKRIAYAANENPGDPSYPLYKLQGAAGLLELADRNETVQYGYYLNKALLVAYLNSLRGQLTKNPNPVLAAQLGALINQANEQLDAGVSKDYQDTKSLPANQPLDSLPKDVKSSDPMGEGPIVLTYGDLAADTDLNNWIQKNGLTLDGKDYKQFNRCGLLKVLLQRASNKVSNIARNAAEKETFQVYAQQVQKLAGEMQCNLAGGSQSGSTNQQGGQANPAQASLEQLVGILPLQRDQLDFGRIRDFVSGYRGIVSASTDANRSQQASTAMDQLEQYMQGATQNTNGQSMTNFSMDGLTADDLVSWATPPSAGQATRSRGSARALSDYLEQVVRNTYILIKDLYNSHYTELSHNPQSLLAVEQQVGGHSIPYGSSVANSNINNISRARARLPQVGA